MLDKLSIILKSSSKITLQPEYRKCQLSPLKYGPVKGRVAYFIMALLNIKDVVSMEKQKLQQFERLVETNPEVIPSIFWPYQCCHWEISHRVDYLKNHFETLSELSYQFDCQIHHQQTIAELDDIYPGMRIVVDRNGLFMREGMIVLNIFIDHNRVFTLAFSVYRDKSDSICAVVGAIQGRKMENITSLYRDMTKKAHGIRPRDLMVEVFQIVCRAAGIEKIIAITDSCRQHHHFLYRLTNKNYDLCMNYDEVWSERGGVQCGDDFYELPLKSKRKPIERVISKKRSMYRKRYDLLDSLEQSIVEGIHTIESPVLVNSSTPSGIPDQR